MSSNDGIDYQYHVDKEAKRFLAAVEYYGGEATTTEIRQRTGLSRRQTNHRFQRLEELELITISYAESGYGDRTPPKIAYLTGIARAEIERGLLASLNENGMQTDEKTDLAADIRKLRQRVKRQQNRIDTVAANQTSSDQMADQLENIEGVLWALEEYTYEWTGTAETYLLALRRVAEEKLDVSMESYIEAVEAEGADDEAEDSAGEDVASLDD